MGNAARKQRKRVHTPFEHKPKTATPIDQRVSFRASSAADQVRALQDRAVPEEDQKKILTRMAIRRGLAWMPGRAR